MNIRALICFLGGIYGASVSSITFGADDGGTNSPVIQYKEFNQPNNFNTVSDNTDWEMPLLSVSTGSDVLDMNWTASLELVAPELRPATITLPVLDEFSIDNLEIKLRVLKLKF